ncbi:MCM2/3/5 family-domain-containing protein [Glomus cerebriforme]|uniref:DNA replication licensing factor MCM3 n=1 Tax=Glomus cerebriforme TaxID=658196 RepID=A0A397S6R6_9GLOM|nr:MCM2/3/5 family-domain-containing protein [Glomus cerebriforme]
MASNTDLQKLQDEAFLDRVRFFEEFLEADKERLGIEKFYKVEIVQMLRKGERRFIVNLNELRYYHAENAKKLEESPNEWIPAFEKALKNIIKNISSDIGDEINTNIEEQNFYIGFNGTFHHHVNPRTLKSIHLGKLICIEGIVSRCSLVRLKLAKSVHYCEKTGNFCSKEYHDSTSIGSQIPSSSAYPTEDENGNPLTTEFGYSVYRDHQTICLQEMPEKMPPGLLTRSIDIILDDDLVDKVKPGDRIQLAGCYRAIGKPSQGSTSATFKTVIIANNVTILSGEIGLKVITDIDIANIEKISKNENIFELLSRSLAPSIYGHDMVKKAILLMLLGGKEQNLSSGTHIRGDINILMVGDPSTSKSQLLRRVLNIAPLAIATTGRGSTGVGLTAAVTRDKETGEKSLEAGAMVLGDRGVVCIDEFDKMIDTDRVAIHEVMEQQTVTIAKAGIHTSLNARCSVIAAANPIYGQYNIHKDPAHNIALPDSLLSRFDLVFVITDEINEVRDSLISRHVLRLHEYRPPNLEEGVPIKEDSGQTIFMEEAEKNTEPTPVYMQYDLLLNDNNDDQRDPDTNSDQTNFLSSEFLKKYIQYAKSHEEPRLGKAAAAYLCELWVNLRNEKETDGQAKTSPLTPRALDSLFRLATAHTKARLGKRVTIKDAKVAEEIVRFALFKEVSIKDRRKRRKTNVNENDELDSDDDNDDTNDDSDKDENSSQRSINTRKDKGKGKMIESPTDDTQQFDSSSKETEDNMDTDETRKQSFAELNFDTLIIEDSIEIITSDRLRLFQENLNRITSSPPYENSISLESLIREINNNLPENQAYTSEEVNAALKKMQDRNKVMISDDTVYII